MEVDGEEQVQVLSATKQRRSIGETKKREKARSKPARTAVVVPGDVEWPDVEDDVEKDILGDVERALQCLKIPNRTCPLKDISKVSKEDRAQFRKNWVADQALKVGFDIASFTSKRSQLCIGVNSCSVAMEGDHLFGLIVEKKVDPQIITKLLVPIARSRNVPIISVTGLRESVHRACGIRCIALGFKRECAFPESNFYSLLTSVKNHCPVDINTARLMALRDRMHNVVQLQPVSISLASTVMDEGGEQETRENAEQPQPTTTSTLSTKFSIRDEVEKLDRRKALERLKRDSMAEIQMEGLYSPPKIRKTTPQ